MSDNTHKNKTSSLTLSIVTVVISVIFSLFLAETLLKRYSDAINHSSEMDPGLLRYHPQMGWSLTPNWQGAHRHHDFEVNYHINALGFRGELPKVLHKKIKPRITIFGDSFTFGLGANEQETYTAQLQALVPDHEWFNAAVPGTSTDQQWLYWQMLNDQLRPDHVIIAVYLGNDLLDNPLPFPLQAEQAKPVFTIDAQQQLTLTNTPVPRQGKPDSTRQLSVASIAFGDALNQNNRFFADSAILQRLMPRTSTLPTGQLHTIMETRLVEQKRLQQALIAEAANYAKKNQQTFSLVLLPGQSFVTQPLSVSATFQDHVRRFMLNLAEEQNIHVVDVSQTLRDHYQHQRELLFHPNEGHFTQAGHRVVAEALAEIISKPYGRE